MWNLKRIATATIILILLGVGLLVWQAAPDSVPIDTIEPAPTIAPPAALADDPDGNQCCTAALTAIIPALDEWSAEFENRFGDDVKVQVDSAREFMVQGQRDDALTDLKAAVQVLSGGDANQCDDLTVCGRLFVIVERVRDVPDWACPQP